MIRSIFLFIRMINFDQYIEKNKHNQLISHDNIWKAI